MKKDRIQKSTLIKAPVSRVWRALTDSRQFGAWFRVKLTAPFKAGKVARGHITWPGYEHLVWEATITAIEPEHTFAFTWHPYAIDPDKNYSKEKPTLVVFTLKAVPTGTKLIVTETGFAQLPPARYSDAMRMNTSGWTEQMKNIRAYVATS